MDYAREYGRMHENDKRFPGYSLGDYVKPIAKLVEEHKPERLLDYGSGKGMQYLAKRLHERWGGLLPYCYDVGVRQLAELPEGTFGGVICTDVLEHIAEPDLPKVVEEIFWKSQPDGFVFLAVSCRPTRKTLPGTQQDVHLTIRPPSWWKRFLCDSWGKLAEEDRPRLVVYWDVDGHFDEPETPWDSRA